MHVCITGCLPARRAASWASRGPAGAIWDCGVGGLRPGASLSACTLVSLCAQEVGPGPEVAEEVVSAAEPGVGAEAEAQVAVAAQPQPLLAMTGVRRESEGMEVAVLTDALLPVVDRQQVLAR